MSEKDITPNNINPKVNIALKHIGAYIVLLLVALLYFKPVAFDGMSLQQHDNLQAIQMQKEINDYRAVGQKIKWTNQYFGGMPTTLMVGGHNINYTYPLVTAATFKVAGQNECGTLFFIMLCCYIGLSLLGGNTVVNIGLSIMLGFFTSNSLYIAAGHMTKMHVLATVPLILGAFVYAYRKNWLLGAAIFGIGISYNIVRNHIQMTYYMFFVLGILGLFFLIEAVRKQEISKFTKFAGGIFVVGLLALFSNLGILWPNYEYSQESTRGKSELTSTPSTPSAQTAQKDPKDASSGLPYEYVFGMSMEKMEIATLMFPNFYGGTQGKSFYSMEGSRTQAAFSNPTVGKQLNAAAQKAGATGSQVNDFVNTILSKYTRQYRGSQTMSGGPMYYGVVVCFLFILSLLLMRGVTKWGFIAAFGWLVLLAWGKHFAVLNDLMYYYFPLYAKFRDVKMTLLVGQSVVVLAIGMGIMELVNFKAEKYANTWSAKLLPKLKQEVSREGYIVLTAIIALGICIFLYLYMMLFGLSSPKDAELAVVSPNLVAALKADRMTLFQGDIFRAMGFIVASTAVLYLYAKKNFTIEIAAVIITALACFDLGMVNGEYITEESYNEVDFVDKAAQIASSPKEANKKIMKDKSIYNVVDYSNGYPSQNAEACSYHKSMGGYNAAKPLLYQEFWSRYQMDVANVALQQHSNLMNMLNVKYIILPSQDRQGKVMDNPTALGNAWLVEKINVVANADEELAALDKLDPVLNAVVQQKYADYVSGLNTAYSAGDKIYLKKYHPDTMTYQSETSKDRFAVFSEMYYPPAKGWNVYLDGQKVDPFVKTNYVLRGLKVPAGKHEIKMVFEPTSIAIGRTVGAICSIIILGLLCFAVYLQSKK